MLEVEVCRNPIFIVGSPRSGTTALAAALSEHSELWTGGESTVLYHLFHPDRLHKVFEWGTLLPASSLRTQHIGEDEFLRALGVGVNALFTTRSGGKRWIDQTPTYTLMLEELAVMFPDAQFLHILRDGRKVVHSMLHMLQHPQRVDPQQDTSWQDSKFMNFVAERFSNFRSACLEWIRHVQSAMEFQQRHPDRCLTVVNEALAAQPKQGFGDIFRFLRVPHEIAPIEYFQTRRINSSFTTVWNAPMTVGRQPDPWDGWTVEQQETFLEVAGQALVVLGLASKDELDQLVADVELKRENEDVEYRLLTTLMREELDRILPKDGTILVVSEGDNDLLQLSGRVGRHFPHAVGGDHAGHNPATSDEAIAHLEKLRAEGADYLVFPYTAFWWLEYYEEFARYLEAQCTLVEGHNEVFRVYALHLAHPSP